MARPKVKDRIVLDWLRFSIPYEFNENDSKQYLSNNLNPQRAYKVNRESAKSLLLVVLNALSLDGKNYTNASLASLSAVNKALYGYDKTYMVGRSHVMLKTPERYMTKSALKMGVCVDLSSHALRDIENSSEFTNWTDWLLNIRELFPSVKFSRVDLAADFFHDLKQLTPLGLHKIARQSYGRKLHVNHIYRSKTIVTTDLRNGKIDGSTFYLGSSSSSYMLRVYDKYNERLNSHGDSWLKKSKIKNWTRYEFECHSVSGRVIELLANGVDAGSIWLDLLRKMMFIQASPREQGVFIDVLKFNSKSKKYKTKKVEVPKFWAKFVKKSNVPKFDYKGKSPHWTYDKHMKWLEMSVLPSFTKDLLAQIMQGGDVETYLNHIIKQGMSKLTPRDADDIVKWSESLKVSTFKARNNEFDFRSMIKDISDQFTGMVGQRYYDLKNVAYVKADDFAEIELQNYADFIVQNGLKNDVNRLVKNHVISPEGQEVVYDS